MRRWVVVGLAVVLLLVVAALVLLPRLVDLPRVRQLVAQEAGRALGRPVRFEGLSLSLFPLPAIEVKKLSVAEDPRFGSAQFLTADEIRLRLKLSKLFSGQIEFSELQIDRPKIRLVQDYAGGANYATLGAPATPHAGPKRGGEGAKGAGALAVAISEIRIRDAALSYETLDRAGRLSGRYEISGLALAVNGVGGGPLTLTAEGVVRPGEIAVKLNAEVAPSPSGLLQSKVKGDLSLDAKDLGQLAAHFMGGHPSLSGSVRGAFTLSGVVGKLDAKGEIASASITAKERQKDCPPPELRSLTLEQLKLPVAVNPGRAVIHPLTLRVAGGDVSLAVNLAWEPAPFLSLTEISFRDVGLKPILADYLCQGYAVNAPLTLKGDLSAPLQGDLFLKQLNGSGQLKIGAGTVTGPAALAVLGTLVRVGGAVSSLLTADLPLSLLSSPLEFTEISASYTIKNGTITTKDLLYSSRQLSLRGAGSYRLPDQQFDFDAVMETGRGRMSAKIVGPASSPSVRLSSTAAREVEDALKKLLRGLRRP